MEWCAFVTIFNGNYKTLWLSHFKCYSEAEEKLCNKLMDFIDDHKLGVTKKFNLEHLMYVIGTATSTMENTLEVAAEIVKIGNNKEHEFLL